MKKIFLVSSLLFFIASFGFAANAQEPASTDVALIAQQDHDANHDSDHGDHDGDHHHANGSDDGHGADGHSEDGSEHATGDGHHDGGHGGAHHDEELPPIWTVIPFVALLLMIATGPLFYAHFWHHNYGKIAIALGVIVAGYYVFVMHDTYRPLHSLFEYISFISLLTALFVASGGILLGWDQKGSPMANVILLIVGAAIANIIGTTGASMLLIRPFIRLNKGRIKPFHIVFFIFMVSNVGGSLTPIGDPPLFLGFLKGVPFEWTIIHIWVKWFFGIGLLALIFYVLDARELKKNPVEVKKDKTYSGRIGLKGGRNIIFLAITIAAVFLDPNKIAWVPAIELEHAGHISKVSFIREIIMLLVAFVAYKTSDKECLKRNDFNFEPILEVAYLFVGIFGTMIPALQLVGAFAGDSPQLITTNSLYWLTGALSGVLDNAPTYMNFLSAAIGKAGMDINSLESVAAFSATNIAELTAISVASVFFGAMTYIGNAPNFMVKSIAEQIGIEMPSFVAYIVKYSLPFLLPVLFLTWIVFFMLGA